MNVLPSLCLRDDGVPSIPAQIVREGDRLPRRSSDQLLACFGLPVQRNTTEVKTELPPILRHLELDPAAQLLGLPVHGLGGIGLERELVCIGSIARDQEAISQQK